MYKSRPAYFFCQLKSRRSGDPVRPSALRFRTAIRALLDDYSFCAPVTFDTFVALCSSSLLRKIAANPSLL